MLTNYNEKLGKPTGHRIFGQISIPLRRWSYMSFLPSHEFPHNTAMKQSEREERTGKRVEMARKAMDGEAEHSALERLPVGRHVGQM